MVDGFWLMPLPGQTLNGNRVQTEVGEGEGEEQQHSFVTIKVVTDEAFSRHEDFDLAAFDESNLPLSDLPTFRVPKHETYSVFKHRVAQHFGYPESQIRLWVLINRENKTVRPEVCISENEPSLSTLC